MNFLRDFTYYFLHTVAVAVLMAGPMGWAIVEDMTRSDVANFKYLLWYIVTLPAYLAVRRWIEDHIVNPDERDYY